VRVTVFDVRNRCNEGSCMPAVLALERLYRNMSCAGHTMLNACKWQQGKNLAN
jgi:hypothetical protein